MFRIRKVSVGRPVARTPEDRKVDREEFEQFAVKPPTAEERAATRAFFASRSRLA
jgi:hypothetical protein